MTPIQLEFLGTGTSGGVPLIGCSCPVCTSLDARNHRLRSSVIIRYGTHAVVIDCGPDFRQQMLRAGISDLDAVVLTHEHNDHVCGLDDVRPINFLHRKDVPLYGLKRTLEEVRRRFSYIFDTTYDYPGKPRVNLVPIEAGSSIEIGQLRMEALEVMHGPLPILGFRVEDFAYVTDAKTLSEDVIQRLSGLKHLVINALHRRRHQTHLNLEEALELIAKIDAENVYLTHVSHDMGLTEEVNGELPDNVQLAFDGLELEM